MANSSKKKKLVSRRGFISRIIFGLLSLAFIDAFWFERYIIDWNYFNLSAERSDGIKVIHLSDLHIHTIKAFHFTLADRINEEKPDVLFFTGDSVDGDRYIQVLDQFLELISLKIPKYAILGNVDYEGRVEIKNLARTYEKYNGKLLINQHECFKKGERNLNIIGVDDYLCGNPDYEIAAKGLNFSDTTIVLNHCPAYRFNIDAINASNSQRVALILSGHTHGGQITFFGKPIFTPYGSANYVKGWYKSPYSDLYVSKGIGTRVIPFRFGSRAEAIIFMV